MDLNEKPENNPRAKRVHEFEAQGINPYAHNFHRSSNLIDIRQDFRDVGSSGDEIELNLCGRVEWIEEVDGMLYVEIEEQAAWLQVMLHRDWIGADMLKAFKAQIFVGDFVGFRIDIIYRTHTQELTARVRQWELIAPCVAERSAVENTPHAEPRSYHLALDRTARKRLASRSRITRAIQSYLDHQLDAIQINPAVSGVDRWLDGSRSHLLQMIVGGLTSVYQIGKISGHESFDWAGCQQSQRLDLYTTSASTDDLMRLAQRLLDDIALEVSGSHAIPWVPHDRLAGRAQAQTAEPDEREVVIDLKARWAVHAFYDLVQKTTGIDFLAITSVESAIAEAEAIGVLIDVEKHGMSVESVALEVAQQAVFPHLIQPTVVNRFPARSFPLVKHHPEDHRLCEYSELYINGIKFASAENEVTNPRTTAAYFAAQSPSGGSADNPQWAAGRALVDALRYGLPPTGGLCLAIDRIVMLLTGATDVRDVIFFP